MVRHRRILRTVALGFIGKLAGAQNETDVLDFVDPLIGSANGGISLYSLYLLY